MKITLSTTNVEGWSNALVDAESLLHRAQAKVEHLKETIRTIKRKIKDGEPWPGAVTLAICRPVQESSNTVLRHYR